MFGSKAPQFTADSIPDLSGRVILVTGGNTGLGKESILAFVKKGAKVYMASRTESKALAAIEEIKAKVPTADLHYLSLDLTSFASISSAASTFSAKEPRLHVLLNNAGVMALPYSRTHEGYEIQFGTNHMGHFLFTKRLLPVLEATAEQSPPGTVRIVNLASIGHNGAFRGINFDNMDKQLESGLTWERYGVSKLANILHAKVLAKKYPKIVCVSAHPGVVASDLYTTFVGENFIMKAAYAAAKSVGFKDVHEGALNQIWCAADESVGLETSGAYFVPVGRRGDKAWWLEKESKHAKDEKLADRLWEWSEAELEKHGY